MVERAAAVADLGIKAHASPRLRLQAGDGRPRHPIAAGLFGAPQHPEHHKVHSACAGSVQELLAGLTAAMSSCSARPNVTLARSSRVKIFLETASGENADEMREEHRRRVLGE